jgi:hypothetical protein
MNMEAIDEPSAWAIVYANTKRKNRSEDIVIVAKCFDYLIKTYGSVKHVAKIADLSPEMVRQFLTVLKLPKEVQILFEKRVLDSVDIAKELYSIKNRDLQIQLAGKIVNSPSKNVRDIKRILNKYKHSADEAIEIIQEARPEKIHLFILDLNEEVFKCINNKAKENGTAPADLVKLILNEWLQKLVK